ncbi:ATP-binding protein [Aquipuribacter nitratireducens]|uniref:ATP-binding protein n=1 Tax=Aquipuribacter nitratireducens TaxID=650104 RepID=A0ABW0GHB4_9MICO
MTLFPVTDLEVRDSARSAPGFRLHRLEVLNWGTFDGAVWSLTANGHDTLLTGDIGSGKSTLVDAVTTLLLPPHRIAYNRAAGAETRERDLRSYVEGHYTSRRHEETGFSRPVGLRGGSTYSVLLGCFANPGLSRTVTLAQVFWLREGHGGQPERYYVVSDTGLTIAGDLAGFGGDPVDLKRRLRREGHHVSDSYPGYGTELRRRLGVPGEQALELFHQTVSMKSVGDLNEFVRRHMLEPLDTTAQVQGLVRHYEDLTRAHEAVLLARAQLDSLAPVLGTADDLDAVTAGVESDTQRRDAVPFWAADRGRRARERQLVACQDRLGRISEQLRDVDHERRQRSELSDQLLAERAGHGGDRLAAIELDKDATARQRDERRRRHRDVGDDLARLDLPGLGEAEAWPRRLGEVEQARTAAHEARERLQEERTKLEVRRQETTRELDEVDAELTSLRSRQSALPRESLEQRRRLCEGAGLAVEELPFVGELVRVREGREEWEGAAERLLRGFALSLLVPAHAYQRVARWVDATDLRGRLVYLRVPERAESRPLPEADDGHGAVRLWQQLEVRRDGPGGGSLGEWVQGELARRASHVCVADAAEFRAHERAITARGQVKHDRTRHEKDDRRGIGQRSSYVLGWSNRRKMDALLEEHQRLRGLLDACKEEQLGLGRRDRGLREREDACARLRPVRVDDIDWWSAVRRIDELEREAERLRAASTELRRVDEELAVCRAALADLDERRSTLDREHGQVEQARGQAERDMDAADRVLQRSGAEAARGVFAELDEAAARAGADLADDRDPADLCSAIEDAGAALGVAYAEALDRRLKRQSSLTATLVRQMGDFRRTYPQATEELDDSAAAVPGYRELHVRLRDDDLPRFEQQFRSYLTTNAIREIAGFHSRLRQHEELLRDRVGLINDSLAGIEYNPGRYIRLLVERTPNTEVRQFLEDLRACTDGALDDDGGQEYAERAFEQVRLIVERFRGREGHTEADRAWTQRVTDVRNWCVFAASERWRDDDSEHEHYTDSGGKSGGQKEKLAYTILAASLAYQFAIEWGAATSPGFRFVVIDEAFGRGSDESTRYALRLFARLGLQLLVVTPLQKIHVIEPHVSVVGLVDNIEGRQSRLRTMTIEEYRSEREAHRQRQGVVAG